MSRPPQPPFSLLHYCKTKDFLWLWAWCGCGFGCRWRVLSCRHWVEPDLKVLYALVVDDLVTIYQVCDGEYPYRSIIVFPESDIKIALGLITWYLILQPVLKLIRFIVAAVPWINDTDVITKTTIPATRNHTPIF